MSKLTRALAVAASLVSIATGVLLLSQEALAQEATSELKEHMTASLSPEQLREQDRAALKARLEALTGFSAHFKQELTDSAGNVLSEGVGQIFLLRPNHFLMHNQSPDELAFYTKDSDLYYYDAMVNQLSITSLDALGANPLMLLADIDNVIWDEYEVLRLTIRMDDGNTNFYLFSEQSAQVDPTVFDFKLPDDVEIDDMR